MDDVRQLVLLRLEPRGWDVFVSGFIGGPAPSLFLDPQAPAEAEELLADLVEQGLVVERARLTLELE